MGQFNLHIRALVGLNVGEILGVTHEWRDVGHHVADGRIDQRTGDAINTAGWTWEDLAVQRNAGIVINLPGGGGGRGRGGGGGGRGGGGGAEASATELTTFMQASQDYNTKRAAGGAKLDLVYEAMRPLFKKEVPAIMPANTEAQIKAAVDFGSYMAFAS
jgi:hypothetical protein